MSKKRLFLLEAFLILCTALILLRLLYWQVFASESLQAIAQLQRQSIVEIPSDRGKIYTSDDFPIVNNQPAYLLYAYTPDLNLPAQIIASQLAPLTAPKPEDILATPSAELINQLIFDEGATLAAKLTNPNSSWIPLKRLVLSTDKQKIEQLGIKGLGFEEYQIRLYPEASMAAQLTGFVGSDGAGNPKGYFGLEGFYDFELTGKSTIIRQETDALGKPIAIGDYNTVPGRDGRNLKTHINRAIQQSVEGKLKKAIEKYQAASGEVIIMDPHTGGILALASSPSYSQDKYKLYPQSNYRIPAISEQYEPGSTFKTIIMASALDKNVITPDSRCDDTCNAAVTISGYDIKTWNNEYHPNQTMTEVLQHSDNTGMVFVSKQLGQDDLISYLKNFGFDEPTNIDLESENTPKLRQKWYELDLAAASFGQGIAVTSVQMLRAVAALSNGGKLLEPHIVSEVVTHDQTIPIKPKVIRQVIKPETSKLITEMMEIAAEDGEAKWAIPKGYRIAGKTGTAQIAISGHYDKEKTTASFVGFAPANNPKFVMLVKLDKPQTSQWASETAAPLWYSIAKDLFNHLNISPQ